MTLLNLTEVELTACKQQARLARTAYSRGTLLKAARNELTKFFEGEKLGSG